jgi:hypothetical protein
VARDRKDERDDRKPTGTAPLHNRNSLTKRARSYRRYWAARRRSRNHGTKQRDRSPRGIR